jgi:hypothetical protein
MNSNDWLLALVVLSSGLLFGEIAGRLIRRSMSRPERSTEVREMARPVGTFVFWAGTALGLFAAVATSSPKTVHQIPDKSLVVLPNLLLGAVFLIAGYALSIGVSTAVGQSALRASGVRHRALERLLRATIVGAAIVLALSQVGVDTTILVVVLAVLLGAPGLAFALLTGFGGREVAANLAAGRALRGQLHPDVYLVCRGVDGRVVRGVVVAVHPVTVEILSDDMATVHVPLGSLLDQPFEVQPARSHAPGAV